MAPPVRSLVIDLDGSLTAQPGLRQLLEGGAAFIEARDLAPRLRILGARKALGTLEKRIEQQFGLAGPPPLIFYGSGDFHHLAGLFARAQRRPFMLLHIDNHPDWTVFPATWNCGAWVNRVLEMPLVERVVTIGPAGDDMVRPWLKSANLQAVRQGRLEVHPWRAPPGPMWGRSIDAPGCFSHRRRLYWQAFENRDFGEFAEGLDQRLPALPFWVSLDKDALIPAQAVTNWDQGGLELEQVLMLVRRLALRRQLLGMDVCGDYSPPVFTDPFRAFLSATDRAAVRPAAIQAACAINDSTNKRIIDAASAMAAEGLWAS